MDVLFYSLAGYILGVVVLVIVGVIIERKGNAI